MAVDNTHTKYLKGSDKRAWENYKTELEAQKKNEDFFKQFANLGVGETLVVSGNERGGSGNVASGKKKR